MQQNSLEIIYLIASVLFVIGLKMLSGPQTARKGNLLAAVGMGLAIIFTIFLHKNEEGETIKNHVWIFTAVAIGIVIGVLSAKKVKMTAMPQMVSLFNGMGGGCAALIALVEFGHITHISVLSADISKTTLLTIIAGLIIGTVSMSGSFIAYLKLQGIMNKTIKIPFYNSINNILLLIIVGLSVTLFIGTEVSPFIFYSIFVLSFLYGILFVVPIGGADMPVVISLLNSFTGVAAAFGGFLYGNQVMLTGGILVGSAGTLLTFVMCKAMNRSLGNVIFGSWSSGNTATGEAKTSTGGSIKEINVNDAAVLMNYSKRIIIVPGYGLAVAQAQHIIHELELLLEDRGVEVKYAIHPVAGRMPGHMNVLLAESNVEYAKLAEMEEVNPEFPTTDVVIVVGANDVVNPAAKTDPSSPIFGMPVLDVENAKNIIVIKRSMSAGYAGIDNELFGYPNCFMLFDDAKSAITKLVSEIKSL